MKPFEIDNALLTPQQRNMLHLPDVRGAIVSGNWAAGGDFQEGKTNSKTYRDYLLAQSTIEGQDIPEHTKDLIDIQVAAYCSFIPVSS